MDFFPLTVNYHGKDVRCRQDPRRLFQARRTVRTEKETLVSCLIDRPIRPLFPEGYLCDTQVDCNRSQPRFGKRSGYRRYGWLLGCTHHLRHSIPRPNRCCTRWLARGGAFVLNPLMNDAENTELDLVVAGTKEGVLMVESEAKELSESVMLDAVMFGHKNFQPVIDLIIALAEMSAKEARDLPPPAYDKKALQAKLKSVIGADVTAAYNDTSRSSKHATPSSTPPSAKKAKAGIAETEFVADHLKEGIEQLQYDHGYAAWS